MKEDCRKAFAAQVLESARTDSNIWAVCTDSRGSAVFTDFADELPNQFVEMGIAEQNAVSVSSGIAMSGKNVFLASPGAFLSARSFEQVKVDVAYNNANVKLVAVSSGLSYGPLGGTHTCIMDIAAMRTQQNMRIYAPADAIEARMIAENLASSDGPAYVRLGRGAVDVVYDADETFEFGKAKVARDGSDATIIACGEVVSIAVKASELLAKENIKVRVLDMYCLKPADEEAVIRAAEETGAIVTVEEHCISGGLGEMVCQITAAHSPVPVKVLGFPIEDIAIGSRDELLDYYCISPEAIAEVVKNIIKKKAVR